MNAMSEPPDDGAERVGSAGRPQAERRAVSVDSVWRALTTLSEGNRVLVRAQDEHTLRQQMCEAIVQGGGYPFAWYGTPVHDDQRSVRPVAIAGEHPDYLDEVQISWGEGPLGRGPTGTALRTRQTQVLNDMRPDADFKPWLSPALSRGFRASISLPVVVRGEIDGALMVYASEVDAFDDASQDLLEDLAADLGYGLSRLLDARDNARAQAELADSEQRYRLMAENSSDVVMLADADLVLKWVSPSARTMFGWDPDAMIGLTAADFVHPEDVAGVRTAVMASEHTGEPILLRYRWRCADGTYRWVEAAGSPIPEQGQREGARVVRLRDIEQQVRAEHDLAAREEQYRMLAENASDVVWQIAPDGRLRWASQSTSRVLGWESTEVLGHAALEYVRPEHRGGLIAMRARVFGGESTSGEFQFIRADGSYRWMEVVIHPIFTESGVARIAALRDVEEEVKARTQLEFALGHDQLTGLAVRRVTLGRIAAAQQRLSSSAAKVGVLSIGIDSLTTINEGLSYGAGDLVITAVAARLVAAVDGADLVGRGTGDEFLVLLPELSSGAAAASRADELRSAAAGVVQAAGQEVQVTVSVGIAVGGRADAPESLLHQAGLALREAKHQGRNRWAFADPSLAQEAARRVALEKEIRQGLREGEFVPWFQPIVRLDSGQIDGYEALIRWRHGDDWVQPGAFLPVAEASSLICDLDVAVMRRSIEVMASMSAERFVAVNVSTVTLARTPYSQLVADALATAQVNPARLHLEVTETALLTVDDKVAGAIADLAAMGIGWFVDDFGTGYSSISHLRDLPVAGLKLDRSFTAGIGDGDDTCVRLADALVGLARGLELDSVAEGIETSAEAAVLAEQGWRHGQGWLYGRPAPEPID